MNIKNNIIGEAFEIIQEETEKGLTTAKQQVTGNTTPTSSKQQSSSMQSQQPSDAASKPQLPDAQALKQANDQANEDLVKSMYAPTENPLSAEQKAKKELEEKQKAEALKQKLHGDYYEQLVNPPKPQEERPQEKVEREDEEKKEVALQEEEKKQKEELPLVATKGMGTAEKLKGVSG